jgi:AcrR family transcriptional regulator
MRLRREIQHGANTEQRVPLSRDQVLRAALTLADSGGIESLTMRKLGRALGVEAMSLYNHVTNKDDILNGIMQLVLSEVALPPSDADWKAAIRASAISAYEVLLRHPWACNLMMSPAIAAPARLRWIDAVLGTLRQAGFSAELTHHAYHALDSHITGFTLWLASLPALGEELNDIAANFIRDLPVDEYPYMAEHIEYHLRETDEEGEGEFAFGLDLILDGIERMRDQT